MTFPSSFATLALTLSISLLTCPPSKADQQTVAFEKTRTGTDRLQYLLSPPKDYDKDPAKKWSLVIFLHGSGERGSDISRVKIHGPPMLAEKGEEFPFILISPQCPKNSTWSDQPLIEDAQKLYQWMMGQKLP